MSGGSNASIFLGPTGTLPVVNSQGQIYEEVQVAILNQVLFTLATFTYTVGTKTISVFKNGLRLRRAVDYTETSATQVTLTTPCGAGDVVTFQAFAVSTILAPLQNNGVIPAGTTGQVLAKNSGSDYDLKWTSLSSIATLLDQPVQAVASAPTVDVTPYVATTRNLLITGSTQIDGWAITAGQVFLVKFQSSLTLSNSANQVTPTGAAIKVGPNDSCLVRATANNIVEILAFSKSTAVVPPYYNDHRLSLVSAQPVSDSGAAGTLYYTAYKGNSLSLFNGIAWVIRQFTEISIALAGLTVGRPYDVFIYDNAGTPTIELTAWASISARATNLTRQDGVYVKSGDATRRYVGSIYALSANTTVDNTRQRMVWNMYNRVRKPMSQTDVAVSWLGTGVWRQANGNALNQLEVMAGLVEDHIEVIASSTFAASANAAVNVGIGFDSTAGTNATITGGADIDATTLKRNLIGRYAAYNALGFHTYTWIELSAATTTFYGINTGGSGITGSVMA